MMHTFQFSHVLYVMAGMSMAGVVGAADTSPTTRPNVGLARPGVSAGAVTVAPTTQPGAPVNQSIDVLVKKLGADSYAKREEAAEALKKLGKEALPAIQQAANDTDPKIRTGAQALVADINGQTKAQPAPADPLASNGGFNVRVQRQMAINNNNIQLNGNGMINLQLRAVAEDNGVRDTTVNENGHKVHIHQDNAGIKMEIIDNGETKEFKAKDADDLKKNEPEAFKEYEKYGGQGNIIQFRAGPALVPEQ